jgi:2-keto-4-pentenoate hydratase/2-oxohepta-3-ene-1,7-dioic acid hydratase in catechol pathway
VVGLADAQGKTLKALASPQGAPITSVYDLIEHWDSCASHLVPVPRAPEEQIDEVEVQAPLTGRDVLAVGKNYREHAR